MTNWPIEKLGEVIEYEQPTKYLVSSTDYRNEYAIPVLTAGKSFLLGNTNEKNGIFPKDKLPVIIFDDFTTAIKFVDFPFKVKSSAMKILHAKKDKADIRFLFYKILTIKFQHDQHKRYWISECSNLKIPLPPLGIQKQIVERLDKIDEAQKLNDGLIQKTDELFQSLLHKELHPVRDSKSSNGVNPAGLTPTLIKQHTNKLEYVGMSGSRSKNPADASAFVKTSEDKKAMAGKKDWEIKKLGFVYKRITDAILPTKHPEQKFNFIGLENIESNTSRLINLIPVEGKFIKSTKTRFKSGDVLYGKLRPYLNKVWLADFDGICSTDIWVLRAKDGIIMPQLLWAILQQSSIVQKSSASMAGANLPRANKDIFDKIAIAVPSINTQKQIVAKLSAVQSYRSGLTEQKMKLKELFDSVLHRSMSSPR